MSVIDWTCGSAGSCNEICGYAINYQAARATPASRATAGGGGVASIKGSVMESSRDLLPHTKGVRSAAHPSSSDHSTSQERRKHPPTPNKHCHLTLQLLLSRVSLFSLSLTHNTLYRNLPRIAKTTGETLILTCSLTSIPIRPTPLRAGKENSPRQAHDGIKRVLIFTSLTHQVQGHPLKS